MRTTGGTELRIPNKPVLTNGLNRSALGAGCGAWLDLLGWGIWLLAGIGLAANAPLWAQTVSGQTGETAAHRAAAPPRVTAARRFLARRGWTPATASQLGKWRTGSGGAAAEPAARAAGAGAESSSTATWQTLGPAAVLSLDYGATAVPVTGRVAALALDSSNASDIRVYAGTTGGGVWMAHYADAASTSSVVFTPLTDTVQALSGASDASISIGAVSVQPGGTGVILAGTGDPNDELDSYYGAGILRSTDGGNSWTLIPQTVDAEEGLSGQDYSFVGEGIAGFAWSTANAQVVVAAVSQAWEGTEVGASLPRLSHQGLYYSSDGGASWHFATITDGTGEDIQGPNDPFVKPDGNAGTSVVWNNVRQIFIAAVRNHGYYESPDGKTWTRMSSQPGSTMTTTLCPTDGGSIGAPSCPIYRGTLAVNPETGDTFAWTVGSYDATTGLWSNLGIWQDACAINTSGKACTNQTINFTQLPWFPGTNTAEPAIADGGYTLTLVAVPGGAGLGNDTLLFAGADDLWKCSLAMGCQWRNTTNATAGFCAQVAAYQHAVAWNPLNPQEVFLGNDSGLWRSLDQVGESGAACGEAGNTDAAHFQNLNESLGSLAEVESMAQGGGTPYTMMAGLDVNGTAGVKSTTGAIADWPQILGGNGGPVAVDPVNSSNWYVNNQDGVSIYACTQAGACTPSDFGTSPVVDMNVPHEDGNLMTTPAPILVDPVDPTQLLIGTCRVWRVPAGGGWSASNAISKIFDSGVTNSACNGDSPIRSIAAMALAGGEEIIYAGTYGQPEGGFSPYGQVWSATYNQAAGGLGAWVNLTSNKVSNDTNAMNASGMDISSIYIDPHDATGKTVYVTVEGMSSSTQAAQGLYGSTDGGTTWVNLTNDLPRAPVSSVVVDPQNANTVYVATDAGVWFTNAVANCAQASSDCWSVFGAGLPAAPVTSLIALPATATQQVLIAGTYGRGIWMTPLWTSGTTLSSATANPDSLSFGNQVFGTTSASQPVAIENTGSLPLTPTATNISADFVVVSDNCKGTTVQAGKSCTIQVAFRPGDTGSLTGEMTVSANVYGGQLTVDLSGTGTPAGNVTLTPATLDLGSVAVGSTSASLPVTASNSGAAVPILGITITAPFSIKSNACGTSSLAASSLCPMQIQFSPTTRGTVSGTLTLTDGAGTQTVALSGTGEAAATDSLPTAPMVFPATLAGRLSAAQTLSLGNVGDLTLTGIAVSVSGPFEVSTTCGTQLTGDNSCAISVVFAPESAGALTGTLTVTDALRTQTVGLSGTGVEPTTLSANPASLTFATVDPGQSSAVQTVTIKNTNSFSATGLTVSVSSPFSLTVNTCPTSLGAGASCTVNVMFQPASYGSYGGQMSVSSSAVDNPASIPVSGMSSDFALAGVGSTSQTVASGQTASFTLSVTPTWISSTDFSPGGTFSFGCGSLPKNALCLSNPTSILVAAGASGTVTMQISTGSSGSSARVANPMRGAGLPLTCGLFALPLALMWRRRRVMTWLALLVFAVAGVTSCTSSGGVLTGGSGGTSSSGATPAGTYTIPVTATANGVTHTMTVTLTVD